MLSFIISYHQRFDSCIFKSHIGIFNFIFSYVVDSVDENIVGFIIEYVLIMSHFDLPLYDIFINRVNDIRRNNVKCFIFCYYLTVNPFNSLLYSIYLRMFSN